MPTPSGLPKAGDQLVHDSEPDVIWKVVERTSGRALMIERLDAQDLPPMRYWINMHQGGWSLVDAKPKTETSSSLDRKLRNAVKYAEVFYCDQGPNAGTYRLELRAGIHGTNVYLTADEVAEIQAVIR